MRLARPWLSGLCWLVLAWPALASEPTTPSNKAPAFPPYLATTSPATVTELRAMQARVQEVVKKVRPATVGILIGGASGSGVIVSPDGIVLTAGHVSGDANKSCTLVMPDGRRVKGKTLGANHGIDSGMIKITDPGPWPYAELGESKSLRKGEWVVSIGHPNGVMPGRLPVVRLGRVLNVTPTLIQTDCTLVGGDSGGPLFDLNGKVVGIHSRIGLLITANIHVPVDTYRITWDRLAAGEVWGGRPNVNRALTPQSLGIFLKKTAAGCTVADVKENSPASRCGLRPDDRIRAVDGNSVDDWDELRAQLRRKHPGSTARLEIDRDGLKVTLRLILPKE